MDSCVFDFMNEIDERIEASHTLSLNDRIKDNIVVLTNYLKHDGGSGKAPTGSALLVNKIHNLSVIDVDVNKDLSDEEKEEIRKNILRELSADDVVVRTGSGGLHIYCNTDYFPTRSNRMIKCYESNDFDIDLMSAKEEEKRSLIVLPGSKVRANAKSPILKYEIIRGSFDQPLVRNVDDILRDLDVKVKIDQPLEIKAIMDNEDSVVSDELAQALVDGLCDFEVHNDSGNMKLEKEVTLLVLFQAINSLPAHLIEEAYDNVLNFCRLTDSAAANFEIRKARYFNMKTSPYVLVKILKLYQTDYYNKTIKPLIAKQVRIHKIDLTDPFSMSDIRAKASDNLYKDYNDVVTDLSKVIRFIDNEQMMFVQKVFDVHTKRWKLGYLTNNSMTTSLKMIRLWKDGRKIITAYDALLSRIDKLTVSNVCFYNRNPDVNVISVFQGYKYEGSTVDMDVIQQFLAFVKEVICNNDEVIYKYVLGWIAHMMQNPGVKNGTALVLKGLQGIGKNRFTDVIAELLAGYECGNVTEIGELTGNFNSIVEHKMFIVLNELKNCGEDRMANFNALKSIITDPIIRINEKNQPRRTSENVGNFIFVSNNAYPVKIEEGDRRYVVLSVNGKYKGDFDYWTKLCNGFTDEFYKSLTAYFLSYDLSNFNIRDIPLTEAKKDLIEASRSPLDQWICDHYDQLCEGLKCSMALWSKPAEMKDRSFQLQLKDKCERRQIRVDGERVWYYFIKEDAKKVYNQTVFDTEDE